MLWQMLVRSQILRYAQNDRGLVRYAQNDGGLIRFAQNDERHAVTLSEAKGLPSAWGLGY
jgi:hypothetical protein